MVWHSGDDGGKWRGVCEIMFLCDLGAQRVQVDVLLCDFAARLMWDERPPRLIFLVKSPLAVIDDLKRTPFSVHTHFLTPPKLVRRTLYNNCKYR